MASAKSPAKAEQKKAPRPPSNHPTTLQMVKDAIAALNEPKGVPASRIKSYICEKYKDINPASLKPRLRQALTKGLEKGVIIQSKSTLEKPVLMSRFKIAKVKKEKTEKKTADKEKTKTAKTTKPKAAGEKKKTVAKSPKKTKAAAKPKETKAKKVKTPVKKTVKPKTVKPKTTKAPKAPKTPKTPKKSKSAK